MEGGMDIMIEDFESFPKIARLNREIIISEKIDGTNAQILVSLDGSVTAGSRKRYIEVGNDNYGFAKWVAENKDELLKLGPGRHFGEWWGAGIQRKYDMKHKVFSLFNTFRWTDPATRPDCCDVVPVLYQGPFDHDAIKDALALLRENGSVAAPGFMNPEGIVIFHSAGGYLFKVTLENDEIPKGWIINE
jgi:hypothetical protein